MKPWQHGEKKIVTVNIPVIDLKYIQKLMDEGITFSRSEYIRVAVRNQINRDTKIIKHMRDVMADKVKLDPTKWVKIPGYNGNEPVKIIKRLEY